MTGLITGEAGGTITITCATSGVAIIADGEGLLLSGGMSCVCAIIRCGIPIPRGTDGVRIEKELLAENECIADFLNVRNTGPVPGPRRLTCRGGSIFEYQSRL